MARIEPASTTVGASPGARAFWTYWTASATSTLGTGVTTVALPLVAVLVLDAGPSQMGVLAAATYVAWLVLGLPAGALVARSRVRGIQVAADLVRAAAIASVPVAWWLGALTFGHLVGVALVISFASVLFDTANTTYFVSVVPKDRIQGRNSLMSATHGVGELAGPSLGGLLVQAVGAVAALLVDVVSYIASAILLRTLPEQPTATEAASDTPIRTLIAEGWRYVSRHPIVGPCMWAATLINVVCGGQLALFTLYLVRELHAPAGLVGLLLAAAAVGSILGAGAVPWLSRRIGSARLAVVSSFVSVAGAAVIPLGAGVAGMIAFAVGSAIFSMGVVWLSTATRTYRFVSTPPELLSRVMATVRFVSWGGIPVGGLLAGLVADAVGLRAGILALAVATLGAPLVLLASRVRGLRDFPEV
ncbi:MFS transporter [Promicromonospora sp. NPDC057138]|uniref:MFS transporter n=1 Tax=Promicromonospora sp. NPDC057138 TaxID=3346031 RepID=UPI00362AED56